MKDQYELKKPLPARRHQWFLVLGTMLLLAMAVCFLGYGPQPSADNEKTYVLLTPDETVLSVSVRKPASGQEYKLVREANGYATPDFPQFRFNSKVGVLFRQASGLRGEKLTGVDGSDWDAFGLGQDAVQIEVCTQTKISRFTIGKRANDTSYYAFCEPDICLISASAASALLMDVNQMHELRMPAQPRAEELASFWIAEEGQKRFEIIAREDAPSTNHFWVTTPCFFEADSESVFSFVEQLPKLKLERFVAYATPQDMKKYGLDIPSKKIALQLNSGETFEISIGSQSTGGHFYATIDRSGAVYELNKEACTILDSVSLDAFASPFVALVDIAKVKSLAFATQHNNISIEIDRSQGGESFQVEGLPVHAQPVRNLYQSLVETTRSGFCDGQPKETILKVEFFLVSGEKIAIVFSELTDEYCAVTRDDDTIFRVQLRSVENILEKLDELKAATAPVS